MPDYQTRRTMMVDTQVRPADVTKYPVIEAMLSIPRENFVPVDQREAAYMDGNISLGEGRVVYEPRTLAKMLDALDIQNNELVLDLGSGFGYSAAVIARLAEAVVAVEEDPEMAAESQVALSEDGIDNVAVVEGPLTGGAAKHGPYDVITIEGAVEDLPIALLDQLNDGGRIACLYMDGALGALRIGYKKDGDVTWRFVCNAGAPVLPGFKNTNTFVL